MVASLSFNFSTRSAAASSFFFSSIFLEVRFFVTLGVTSCFFDFFTGVGGGWPTFLFPAPFRFGFVICSLAHIPNLKRKDYDGRIRTYSVYSSGVVA
jgi:hypothetical protein